MCTDEESLACTPLTPSCAAWFLTGHGSVLLGGLGVGGPRYMITCTVYMIHVDICIRKHKITKLLK